MKNDPLNIFERLASQAHGEMTSRTDVTDRVFATLRTQPPTALARDPMYLFFTAGSLVAASAAMVVFWLGTSDAPLFALAQPFVTVLQ